MENSSALRSERLEPQENLRTRITKEVKDLLFYAAKEGTSRDVKDFYYGFDPEKIITFIQGQTDHELTRLPAELVDVMLEDKREEIRELLRNRPAFYRHLYVVNSDENWPKIHQLSDEQINENGYLGVANLLEPHLSDEQIIENGRLGVANLLLPLANREAELREEEFNAIRTWVSEIPDERVIESALKIAPRYYKIAIDLLSNPALQEKHWESLYEMAISKQEDPHWSTFLSEMYVEVGHRIKRIVVKYEEVGQRNKFTPEDSRLIDYFRNLQKMMENECKIVRTSIPPSPYENELNHKNNKQKSEPPKLSKAEKRALRNAKRAEDDSKKVARRNNPHGGLDVTEDELVA